MTHSAEQSNVPAEAGTDFVSDARQQLADCAGTIQHCVGQLDDVQIWWRPRAEMNSVGNLMLHLAGNLRQRFDSDIGGELSVRNRFAEFTERGAIPRDELLRKFRDIVGRVDEMLATTAADRLRERRQYEVTAGTIAATVEALIFRTLMHLAGHTQEIVFMARLQLGARYVFKNPSGVPPSMRIGSG